MTLADRIWQWLWEQYGLERRTTQIALNEALHTTLARDRPSIGLFECPTGSGKSLSLLIAGLEQARQTHRPTWIATPRRDLQTQLIRDLDLVTKATHAIGVPPPTSIKLQGLEHTHCHLLASHQPPTMQLAIEAWLQTHPDGNLDELPADIPRQAVSMPAAGCQGEACAFYATCLSQQPRRHLDTCDLVITNHALLASTIRRPFLPAPTTVIIDEGHLFERAIRQTLTFSASLHEINRHAVAFLRHLPTTHSQRVLNARQAINALLHATKLTHGNLTDHLPRKPHTLLPLFGPKIRPHPIAQQAVNNAHQVLDALRALLKTFSPLTRDRHISADKLDIATIELTQAEQNLEAFCKGDFDQYFLTRTDSGSLGFLRIPDAIHGYARKRLWGILTHAVLLSGTLATSNADSFAAIRGVLGIPGATSHERDPFAQTHVLVERVLLPTWKPDLRIHIAPATFPSVFLPKDPTNQEEETTGYEDDITLNPAWISHSAAMILQQDQCQPQGIVVLSTSYAMQDAIVETLAPRLTRPAVIQKKQQLTAAIRHYLQSDPRSIFFTVAGWEGMDLPNPAIQDLFILKLPLQARAKTAVPTILEHSFILNGSRTPTHHLTPGQYYAHIQRPAIITMRQALGRPIRRPHDSGTIWVLDHRLAQPGTQSLFFGGPARRYLFSSTVVTILPHHPNTEAA